MNKRPNMPISSLKIGFVVDDTLDKPDGVQQYVLRMGEWLSAQGHEVHYLVGESWRNDIPHIHSLSRNLPIRFNKNKVSVPLPAPYRPISALLQREQFDVIHVQMPYSPFLAGRVVKSVPLQTVVVGTFHILPYSDLERIATRFLGAVLRRTLKRFDTVLSVSAPAQLFAKQSFGISSTVLPNVVDLSWYRKNRPARQEGGTVKIVFLGRLVERKGAQQLLEAIAALPKATQSLVEVRIGGKGPLLEQLTTYARETGIDSQVHFEGFVAEEDKPAFLAQADIAVFPATGGESFGIVLLEAMAAGAGVVIGGNNAGYSSVLAPWPETLFDPHNTRQFIEVLERMIHNKTTARRIHQQQQHAVTNYDIAKVGPKLVGIYENAIAKRNKKQHNTN